MAGPRPGRQRGMPQCPGEPCGGGRGAGAGSCGFEQGGGEWRRDLRGLATGELRMERSRRRGGGPAVLSVLGGRSGSAGTCQYVGGPPSPFALGTQRQPEPAEGGRYGRGRSVFFPGEGRAARAGAQPGSGRERRSVGSAERCGSPAARPELPCTGPDWKRWE